MYILCKNPVDVRGHGFHITRMLIKWRLMFKKSDGFQTSIQGILMAAINKFQRRILKRFSTFYSSKRLRLVKLVVEVFAE